MLARRISKPLWRPRSDVLSQVELLFFTCLAATVDQCRSAIHGHTVTFSQALNSQRSMNWSSPRKASFVSGMFMRWASITTRLSYPGIETSQPTGRFSKAHSKADDSRSEDGNTTFSPPQVLFGANVFDSGRSSSLIQRRQAIVQFVPKSAKCQFSLRLLNSHVTLYTKPLTSIYRSEWFFIYSIIPYEYFLRSITSKNFLITGKL